MHPEVTKFWARSGKEIRGYRSTQCQYWYIVSDPDYYKQGGPPPPKAGDLVCIRWLDDEGQWLKAYILDGRKYTEAEFLKIIKLKAFI